PTPLVLGGQPPVASHERPFSSLLLIPSLFSISRHGDAGPFSTMTSRTSMGAQPPRPPQRTLSSPGLPGQLPPHQRTLSQQYLPPSPIRKESSMDSSYDSNDVAQNRYNTAPRRGGSRLKLELSTDAIMAEPTTYESPQPIQSRITPMNESSDTVHPSPSGSIRPGYLEPDNTQLPMPKRRARFSRAVPKSRPAPAPAPTPAAANKDNRPKPYTVEYPQEAPRYRQVKLDATRTSSELPRVSNSGYADFFPWSGDHPEDQFSETVIRSGYFHKAPPNQAEAATAKPALFPLLKQKNCLNALSSVFLGVLAQRRHSGQITAPSTFKPPPRVTLTDTKREMWLKDLANPATSLRRLSRTIPHGIRGKVLLEHCLNKNVPTERAVWLAKCVGANDLRAFRRKGVNQTFMGGETKWIRDWTVFVEQFVETVFSSFEMPDWKSKVTYAIRLATNLYTEQLLDRDHYMEWLLSGLESTPQSKLPMWILILQLYWKDLLRLRKTGRRLVASLLNHLTAVQSDPDRDLLIQLSSLITSLLTSLMISNPESFVSPTTWPKHRDALVELIQQADGPTRAAYHLIDSRNNRLVSGSDSASPQSMQQRLVKLLDVTLHQPFNDSFVSQCWASGPDKTAILRTVLDWGTSPLRPGSAKVYVTVRLLRSWSKQGLDITAAVLEYLDLIPADDQERKKLVYAIVSDLARSFDFSVARYIQWLISRGGLSNPEEIGSEGPCSTRLLVELPTHALNPSLRCMRGNLLRRASFDVEEEKMDVENAIKLVKQGLGLPLSPDDPISQRKPMPASRLAKPVSRSSRGLQTSIGAFLRDQVFAPAARTTEGPGISCAMFNYSRTVLEAANDFEMLLGTVALASKISNPELLASCTETVNVHLTTFAAMEDVKKLFDSLMASFKTISDTQGLAPARVLLASLASLADRIPGLEDQGRQLRSELLRCDRTSGIDACSPVSDNMAGYMQDIEGTLYEEVEKVLSTGTRVDQPTMDRLFRTIIGRLESCWSKSIEAQRGCIPLLTRLRAFDAQHFDEKMAQWVGTVKTRVGRPPLVDIFPLLIGQGCLGLTTILKAYLPNAPSPVSTSPSGPYLQETLQLTSMRLPQSTILMPEECCRFYIQQRTLLSRHSDQLRRLLNSALAEYCEMGGKIGGSGLLLDGPGCWPAVLDLFKNLVLIDPSGLAQDYTCNVSPPSLRQLVDMLATQALGLGDGSGPQISFDSILEMANELSLPFCQVKLSLSLSDESEMAADHQTESHISLFTKAMERAIEANNVMWTSMLPHLNDTIAQHVRNEARSRFIDLVPSFKTPSSANLGDERSLRAAESLVSVMESITSGHPASKATQLTPSISEKVSDLWDILSSNEEEKKRLHILVLTGWLPLMLKFVAMHIGPAAEPAPAPTPGGNTIRPPPNPAQTELKAKVLLALAGIFQELDALDPAEAQVAQNCGLAEQVLDVAMVLVDGLPDEARAHCCRLVLISEPTALQNASSDPRLRYLLSYMPPQDNLMLSPRNRMSMQGGSTRTAMLGAPGQAEKLMPFSYRRWEVLNEPTPNVGENDTSPSLTLFEAIKLR
ncbi:hypothetical protein jhhlp_003987, partial [Lomentospora prolificans]